MEQGAGSKEQGAGSREQGAGSREPSLPPEARLHTRLARLSEEQEATGGCSQAPCRTLHGHTDFCDENGKLTRREYAPGHANHGHIDFHGEDGKLTRREFMPSHALHGHVIFFGKDHEERTEHVESTIHRTDSFGTTSTTRSGKKVRRRRVSSPPIDSSSARRSSDAHPTACSEDATLSGDDPRRHSIRHSIASVPPTSPTPSDGERFMAIRSPTLRT